MKRFCPFVVLLVSAAISYAAADVGTVYKKHCAGCHGNDGKAQTRLGKKSGAKDLSNKEAQAKLSDADMFKTIKDGRKNAKGEEKMEAFGDDLSDQQITELVAFVRKLAK